MAINLSSLNISLDKFNAESSGTYNIGQLKLSSDGKSVYRTNNHKTWTIFNSTKISSEEALAVKFAFCKALSKEGLSQDAIDSVKTKLGIPGSALDALKAGNIKPLTAAEVREVIDQYAGQINERRASAANGAKMLKTSADLYRGVDKEEMADRASTRNEINAKSIKKAMTGADRAVNNLLDMIQDDELGDSVSPSNKAMAREIMTSLGNPGAFDGGGGKKKPVALKSAPIQFILQDSGKVTAKVTLGNRNSFSLDTGLTREALAEKAAEMLNAIIASEPKPRAVKPHVEKKSSDDEIMNAINEIEGGAIETEEVEAEEIETAEIKEKKIKAESAKVARLNNRLLEDLADDFNTLKNTIPEMRRRLRDTRMEDTVSALQKAMDKVRPLDVRNTDLINQVRQVFWGNMKIDTDKLLNDISGVLNKKRVDYGDKVDKNIKKAEEDIKNNIEIDFDKAEVEPLNINAWLEES